METIYRAIPFDEDGGYGTPVFFTSLTEAINWGDNWVLESMGPIGQTFLSLLQGSPTTWVVHPQDRAIPDLYSYHVIIEKFGIERSL